MALLPHDSTVSVPVTAPDQPCVASPAVASAAAAAAHVVRLLRRDAMTPVELAAALSRLHVTIANAGAAFDRDLLQLAERTDREASTRAVASIVAEESTGSEDCASLVRDYDLYDRFFQLFRVQRMTTSQLTAQVTRSCQRVLTDLPCAIVGLDEVTALVEGMGHMLDMLASTSGTDGPANDETSAHPDAPAPHEGSLTDAPPEWPAGLGDRRDWTCHVAYYRWLTGHHLFHLATIFCRESLRRAIIALEHDDLAAVEGDLHRAGVFLRTTTAAMWYASAFPRAIYQELIRPAMVSTESPHGFSGTQNADYTRLRTIKAHLNERLATRFGHAIRAWPPEAASLATALTLFHEIDIADAEHHSHIILSKAGLDSSLAQKKFQGGHDTQRMELNALTEMRALREDRLHEWAM